MLINKTNLQDVFRGLNANFQRGFGGVTPQWSQIATLVPSSSAQETYPWLGGWPSLREWVDERHIQALRAHDYTIKNRTFETTISIPREFIEDDTFGVFGVQSETAGQVAAEHPDELTFGLLQKGFEELAYDGQNFFDTDHPVGDDVVSNMQAGAAEPWYLLDTRRPLKPIIFQRRRDYDFRALTSLEDEHVFMRDEFLFGVDARVNAGFGFWQMAFGSKAALNESNFKAARAAMKNFTSDEGRQLGVRPTHIVVGASNLDAAESLFKRQTGDAGAGNTLFNAVQIIESPFLP